MDTVGVDEVGKIGWVEVERRERRIKPQDVAEDKVEESR